MQTIWDELSFRIQFECESCRNLQDEWKDGRMIEWWEKIRESKRGKDKTRQDKDKTKTRQDKEKNKQD